MSNTLFDAIRQALTAHSGSMLNGMTASSHRPIASLSTDGMSSGILILYSSNGAPLRVSSLSDATSNRSAQSLGQQGVAVSYRIIEASDNIADVLVGLMGDIFRLPLSGLSGNGATATPAKKRGRKPGTSKKGKPGRPKGSGTKKRRGRPAKAIAVDGMVEASEAPAKKRRGRPKKNVNAESMAPAKKKAGRPRKNSVIGGDVTSAPAKRRGRPKKIVTSNGEAPAKRKAGRPPGSGKKAASVKSGRGPGRPRKTPIADTAAPKRGPGRPRKNPA